MLLGGNDCLLLEMLPVLWENSGTWGRVLFWDCRAADDDGADSA